MSFDFSTLVTDRTQSDVARVRKIAKKLMDGTASEEEIAEFNSAAMKGAYNYTDLNRVTAAMDSLVDTLNKRGYAVDYKKIKLPREGYWIPGTSRLPAGYTEVAWIQSTGTQYIDTLLSMPNGFRAVFDVEITALNNDYQAIISAMNTSAPYGANYFCLYRNGTSWEFGFNTSQVLGSAAVNTKYAIDICNISGSISCKINGESQSITTSDGGAYRTSNTLYLFAGNKNGSPDDFALVKLWPLKVYSSVDESVLVGDFVPCINPDGEAGLFDLVTQAFFGNAGTGEFYVGYAQSEDENTLLLLHGDSLSESSMYDKTITNYGVVVSSVQSKFGGKSLYFNGASRLAMDGSIFNFGSGDFTVEAWIYLPKAITGDCFLFSGGANSALFFGFNSSGQIGIGRAGVAWDQATAHSLSINAWNHVAVCRKSGVVYFFKNGVLLGRGANTNSYSMQGGQAFVGSQGSAYYFSGYIDELRVSNVARWTENFEPPNTAYDIPDSETPPVFVPDERDPYVWFEDDIPTTSLMLQYVANVAAVKAAVSDGVLTFVPTDMVGLTVTEANAIEQILVTVNDLLMRMLLTLVPAGTATSGGDYL